MKKVVLNIPDNKYSFFMELVKSLGFIKVKEETPTLTKKEQEFVDDLKGALKEVELHQQGKTKLQSARDFLDEL